LQKQLKAATQRAVPKPVVKLSHRTLWLTIAACVIAGLALALVLGPLRSRMMAPEQKHIAVLPFDARSSDPASQSLADGLMESIAGKLAALDTKESLWVVPGSEVRRRNVRDVDGARKEFGATLAVKGAVEKSGDGVHITVDLIDTRNMRLLGSASLERSNAQLASLDDDAVDRLSRFMGLQAHASEPAEKAAGAVYEAYLKGRGYLQQFDKPGNVEAAIQLFESAVKDDPKFALGYSSLAEAYFDRYNIDSNVEWVKKGSEYCNKAMDLNNKLPAIFVTCGRVHDGSGLYDLALSEFKQAMDLDPRSADARVGMASVLEHLKRENEAEQSLKQAVAMRPDYWYSTYQLGAFYLRQKRLPDAEREFRKVLEFSPDSAYAHSNLGSVLVLQGPSRYAEAEAEYQNSLKLGETYAVYNNLGTLYYRQKRWAEAAEMLNKAAKMNPHNYKVWGNLGISYEWIGDTKKADAAYAAQLPLLEAEAKLKPNDSQLQVELGIRYAKLNLREKALAQVEAALARSPNDYRVLSNAAEAYDDLGDRARALSLVSKSLAKGEKLDQLQLNPGLRGVLADPRFRAPSSAHR
jgi:tetratricopeptide (TPR) repeat protein/TolB-like protein